MLALWNLNGFLLLIIITIRRYWYKRDNCSNTNGFYLCLQSIVPSFTNKYKDMISKPVL
jgi:hypothetical protein